MNFFTDLTDEDFERIYGGENEGEITTIGTTWGEFSKQEFPDIEKIIFGLSRGQVGMTIASTNIGKTTFALNTAVTLAAGSVFHPFVAQRDGGRRVMLIDGENTKPELQADLKLMMRDWYAVEESVVKKNLFVMCDEEIDEELLDLTNASHMAAVVKAAKEFKPDIIIVDTLAALFTVDNENDNAEIKKRVISPLKKLAKEANAVVWLQHHIGKQSEDARAGVNAYKGRGASNLGALARSVIAITAPDKTEKERVVLSVAKAKGYRLADVVMRLNHETRWFRVTGEKPPVVVTSYGEIVSFVSESMRTSDIVEAFKGTYGKRTIEMDLNKALESGRLIRPEGKPRGWYAPPQTASSASTYNNYGSAEAETLEDGINKTEQPSEFDEYII